MKKAEKANMYKHYEDFGMPTAPTAGSKKSKEIHYNNTTNLCRYIASGDNKNECPQNKKVIDNLHEYILSIQNRYFHKIIFCPMKHQYFQGLPLEPLNKQTEHFEQSQQNLFDNCN